MSAEVVDIGSIWSQMSDLSDEIAELMDSIPSPSAHLEVGSNGEEVVADYEGATPDGYQYAPGSEEELRQAVGHVQSAARLLQGVLAREWTRCGNDLDGQTCEEYLHQRREEQEEVRS